LVEYNPIELRDGELNDNYYGDGHNDDAATIKLLPGMPTFATKHEGDFYRQKI
jgi:hypothetical protein